MKAKHPSAFRLQPLAFAFLATLALFATAPRAAAQTGWGAALQFDGVDDFVRIANFGLVMPTNEVTVEFWLKVETVKNQVAFTLDPEQATNRFLAHVPWGDGLVLWDFGNWQTDGRLSYSPPVAITNAWHHFAFVASRSGNAMRSYRNGVLEASKTGSQVITRGAYDLLLGGIIAGTTTNCMRGQMDEFRVWNVARSQTEIQADMNRPLVGTEANLVAYYRFDEDTGTTVHDATTNGLHGTLVNGPVWTNVPPFIITGELPQVWGASVAWGDYDNDGRLDILLTGSGRSSSGRDYRDPVWWNTGSDFVNIAFPELLNVHNTGKGESVAWGDYDNDGQLDILLTGWSGIVAPSARVWRNTGNGFTNINAGLPGVDAGSVAWGDYDNDGQLDILLTGNTGSANISQVWRNNGDGTFSDINAGLPQVSGGSVAWGDYDNDGWLDILLTGYSSSGWIAQVWRNTGTNFVNINAGLPQVSEGSVAWGDYDNDGQLDILLTGDTGSGYIAQVWRNTGNGFTNINAGLQGVRSGSAAWGDYDNDGRLDILLTGFPIPSNTLLRIAQVWRNNGDGSFSNIDAGLPGVVYGSVAWGDYDNDGRLDILLTGDSSSGWIAQVWRNNGPGANTPPSPPTDLAAAVIGRGGILSWNAASDGQTPVNGLTYNLRVGTTPGGSNVVSPQAASTGFRRLPAMGNAQHRLSAVLTNLPYAGPYATYYWSVQAVDTAFAGSAFADEGSFVLYPLEVATLQPTELTPTSAAFHGTVNRRENAGETRAWFEYGLTTKYGGATSPSAIGSGPGDLPFSSSISGLLPWMTCHYRAVASNDLGRTNGADVTFTLSEPFGAGTAPSLSGLTDLTLPQGGSTQVWFTVLQADLDVRVRCNNSVLLPDGALALSGSGAARSLSLAPDPRHSGAAQITVTASDGMHAASRTFTLTVTPFNTDPARLLYLTGARAVSAEAWQFRLADFGTAATNYTVEYRSDLAPTNSWIPAPNITDLGGGLYQVDTGPSQGDTGFYRVKGLRWLTVGLTSPGFTVDEGAAVGPVVVFNGLYTGTVNYTWGGTEGTSTDTVQVNGTTAVIPIPPSFVSDNAGIDSLRYLTLRLESGPGFALAGTTETSVTIEENDAAWQGTLILANGLADTTTALLTNRMGGGYASVTLPQNANMAIAFTLMIQQTNGCFQGQIQSDGYGFFPTNALAELTLTKDRFAAVATNVPLPALTGSPLFSAPHYVDVRLDAANAPGQANVRPTQISGVATLVSKVPNRAYLDSALSGAFLLLKPATAPSTNQVPLTPAP